MGMVNSYFTPERTRALLAGRAEGVGNVLAASLGVVTPFCSCSAVPLFIGFVQAGVPLGITFSFLIAAPMVNEVALALLLGLFGWKIAVLYLGLGLAVAIASGWVIGRLHMEAHLEDWVRNMPRAHATAGIDTMTLAERVQAGFAAVREIVGKVWPYVVAGIAIGAAIHGYVPEDFMAGLMGRDAWWSVPVAVLIGVPMYSNAAGIIPDRRGAAGQGRRARHRARVHDERHRAVAARDGHPAQGAEDAAHRHVRRRRRERHPARGLRVQCGVVGQRDDIMKAIKVLGTGCANCRATVQRVEQVAKELGVPITLEKVEAIQDIMAYGILATPGVVVDGKVVHAGGVPAREKIAGWLGSGAETVTGCGAGHVGLRVFRARVTHGSPVLRSRARG